MNNLKLVPFQSLEGETVYVNPDNVSAVKVNIDSGTDVTTEIVVNYDLSYYVVEPLEEVVRALKSA